MNKSKTVAKSIFIILLLIWPILFGLFGIFDTSTSATFMALTIGLLGVFKDSFKLFFLYPVLKVSLKAEPPASHGTTMSFRKSNGQPGEYHTYYCRLKIENIGKVRAENIEVFVSKKKIKAGDDFKEDKSFLPLNLVWSHTREVTKKSIAPGLFKYCDFGHIDHPDYSQVYAGAGAPQKVYLFFDFEVLPNTRSYILDEGVYRFEIIVTSDNSKTVTKVYEIDLKNIWKNNEKEMFANNFIIRELKEI